VEFVDQTLLQLDLWERTNKEWPESEHPTPITSSSWTTSNY
jgi:hypothetical protein